MDNIQSIILYTNMYIEQHSIKLVGSSVSQNVNSMVN